MSATPCNASHPERGICVSVRVRPVVGSEDIWGRTGPLDRSRLLSAATKWRWDANSITAIHGPKDAADGSIVSPSVSTRSASITPTADHRGDPQARKASSFTFSNVFGPEAPTEEVYERIAAPIVTEFLRGFHGCIFAHGETNSGKTHTILGEEKRPGILPMAVQHVFAWLESTDPGQLMAMVKVSLLEVYNEIVRDLLSDSELHRLDWNSSRLPSTLKLLESGDGDVVVSGLSEHVVGSLRDVQELVRYGQARRSIGANSAHEHASRSHTVFQLTLETRVTGQHQVQRSVLNIIDLAGSEATYAATESDIRVAAEERAALGTIANATRSKAEQMRLKDRNREGSNIRKSLHALIRCVDVLAEGKGAAHAPFRDSKLTRLLRHALGGNCNTAIICAVNPEETKETLATLRFAANAARIQAAAKTVTIIDDQQAMLGRYERQLRQLQVEMALQADVASLQLHQLEHRSQETAEELKRQAAERQRLEIQCRNLNRLLMTSTKLRSDAASTSADAGQQHQQQSSNAERDVDGMTAVLRLKHLQWRCSNRRCHSLPRNIHRTSRQAGEASDVVAPSDDRRFDRPLNAFAGGGISAVIMPAVLADQVARDVIAAQQQRITRLEATVESLKAQHHCDESASQQATALSSKVAVLEEQLRKVTVERDLAREAAISNGVLFVREAEALSLVPAPFCGGSSSKRRPQAITAADFLARYPTLRVA